MHNGGSIAYDVTGSGATLVFIHGFTLDRRMWRPQVYALRKLARVVTYDCRGFGESSCPTGPYSHADDLDRLLDEIQADAAHLVGLSMGGRIALAYALRRPDRVASLVLISTDVGGYRYRVSWDVSVTRGLAAAREAWLRHDIFRTVRDNPPAWRLVREMVMAYSGWHWRFVDDRRPPDTDTLERLAEVAAPTTVIVGERDLPDFHDVSRILVKRMPKARKVIVGDSGHLLNLERSTACNHVLAEHLAAVASWAYGSVSPGRDSTPPVDTSRDRTT
jgi:Predicted hydrolases or acyltransferases (alpha/beta hydrolase superfamily)